MSDSSSTESNPAKVVLTGVKPTGQPHLGNYLGAIRPALTMSQELHTRSFLFIADYHSLTSVWEAKLLNEMVYEVAAAWLACGLNPQQTVFYRQSDVPEVFELSWILSCFAAKGLMNRAHAYKAKIAENQQAGREDLDFGVYMGLYSYPILMAADILLFGTRQVPVGEDQVQHVEIARDLAQKINRNYGQELLVVPEFVIQKDAKLVPGLDGRKMSKSYGNHIPLFCSEKKLRQLVMKIKTDSSSPDEPKDPEQSLVFDLFKEFGSSEEVNQLRERYEQGISWGEAKQTLFEVINRVLREPREKYNQLMADREQIDRLLVHGAEQAREEALQRLKRIRQSIGITSFANVSPK